MYTLEQNIKPNMRSTWLWLTWKYSCILRHSCSEYWVEDLVEKIPGPNPKHRSQYFFYKSVKIEGRANDHDIPHQHEQAKEKPAPSKRLLYLLLLLAVTISTFPWPHNLHFVFSAFNSFLTDKHNKIALVATPEVTLDTASYHTKTDGTTRFLTFNCAQRN